MIGGKRILAVVPARGGSKGLPLKNLRPVRGVPLVTLAGQCARAVPEIDRAVVSTDHVGIAEAARLGGLDAPFMRPEHLSGDIIGDIDVLTHALKEMERLDGVTYDIVVMLQPTSPLRRPEHVRQAIRMLVADDLDSVWTLSLTDSKAHPLKQLTVQDGLMDYYDEAGGAIIARQQLEPIYHRNGVAYAITRDYLLRGKTIKGPRTGALVLDGHFVSIDTEWDITLVEFILSQEHADVAQTLSGSGA